MNIFHKRPLCLILTLGIGSFAIFAKFSSSARLAVLLLALIPVLIAFSSRTKTKIRGLLLLSSAVMLISMLFSLIYFDLWFYADMRFTGKIEAYGEVCEIDRGEYYGTVTVKTEAIDSSPLSKYKILVSTDRDTVDSLDLGDRVYISGTLTHSDSSYNISDGINARLGDGGTIALVERRASVPLKESVYYLRENFSRYAISVTDKKSGALLSALLSGDKSYLSSSVTLDFRRIGVSHILALSGMHLAILTFAVNKLLRLLRLGKRTRISVSALFAVGYAVFTGFPITVIRAGTMLLIFSLLSLLRRAHDAPTAIAITLTAIFTVTPYAVFDVGLWLSALATLGVVMAAKYFSDMPKTYSKIEKMKRMLGATLLTTIFAISTTIFITVTEFGTLSLAAPFSTIILSILIEVIMYLGTLTLIVGRIIPLGVIYKPLAHFTMNIAALISDIEGVLVSARDPLIYTLAIILTLLIFGFFVINVKRKAIAVITVCAVFSAVFVSAGVISEKNRKADVAQYTRGDNSEVIYIQSGGENALISFAAYSKSSGYTAAECVSAHGRAELDKYVYTRYSSKIIDDFEAFSTYLAVDSIYLPTPETKDEESILKSIERALSDTRTSIKLYEKEEVIPVDKASITPFHISEYGKSTLSMLGIKYKENDMLYLSSGILRSSLANDAEKLISESDTLIFGSQGKSYSNKIYYDLHFPHTSIMVFSSENLFMTRDNYNYHKNNGCEIYSHPSSVNLLK